MIKKKLVSILERSFEERDIRQIIVSNQQQVDRNANPFKGNEVKISKQMAVSNQNRLSITGQNVCLNEARELGAIKL